MLYADSRDAIVISAVAGKRASQGPHAHGLPENGDLLVWRSADGGRTWSSPSTVNDVAGAAREGLHAMASGAGGLLFTAWLDLREGRTKLYGARSTDGGVTWSKNGRAAVKFERNYREAANRSHWLTMAPMSNWPRSRTVTLWPLGKAMDQSRSDCCPARIEARKEMQTCL